MKRNLINDDDENEDKIELALACVNYLKAVSAKNDLRKYVLTKC